MEVLQSLLRTLYLVVFSDAFTLLFVFISVLVGKKRILKRFFFRLIFICKPNECNPLNIVKDLATNIFCSFQKRHYASMPWIARSIEKVCSKQWCIQLEYHTRASSPFSLPFCFLSYEFFSLELCIKLHVTSVIKFGHLGL